MCSHRDWRQQPVRNAPAWAHLLDMPQLHLANFYHQRLGRSVATYWPCRWVAYLQGPPGQVVGQDWCGVVKMARRRLICVIQKGTAGSRFFSFRGRKLDPFLVPDSGPKNGTAVLPFIKNYIKGPENGPIFGSGIWPLKWLHFPAPVATKNATQGCEKWAP